MICFPDPKMGSQQFLEVGRFYKTNVGDHVLLDNTGFSYQIDYRSKDGSADIYWQCNMTETQCFARATTRGNKIVDLKGGHLHLPSKEPQYTGEEIGKLFKNVGRGSFHFIDPQGYKYFKDNEFPGNKYAWRCSMKKKIKCKARLRTVGCKIYGRSSVQHNHLPDLSDTTEEISDVSQFESDPLNSQLGQYTYDPDHQEASTSTGVFSKFKWNK